MAAARFPLLTERLVLRPFTDDDLDAMHAIYGRDDVNRYLWELKHPGSHVNFI